MGNGHSSLDRRASIPGRRCLLLPLPSSNHPLTYRLLDEISVAAQISIARQISLSQRQLLLPIVPKSQMLVSRRSIKDVSCNMKPRLVEHRTNTAAKIPPEKAVVEEVKTEVGGDS